MAEVVDVYVGEIMLFQKPLELQVDVVLAHVFPKLPREHGSTVYPFIPDFLPAPVLPFFLPLQEFHRLRRQRHHPCAALCLRCGKPVFAVQTVEVIFYGYRGFFQVYLAPVQGSQFAHAQPCVEQQFNRPWKLRVRHLRQETEQFPALSRIQELLLLWLRAWRCGMGDRVLQQQLLFYRCGEDR